MLRIRCLTENQVNDRKEQAIKILAKDSGLSVEEIRSRIIVGQYAIRDLATNRGVVFRQSGEITKCDD